MNRLLEGTAWGVAALLLQACAGVENLVDTTDAYVEGDTLHLSGTMNSRSYREIERLIDRHPELTRIEIGEIDGSVDDHMTLRTGLMLHRAGLDTHLRADSFIESGGVDIFCAGRNRTAEQGAHVGVHSWSYLDESVSGDKLAPSDPEHAPYLDYFETVGCPVDFYWYTLKAASADDIYVMTNDELLSQGVVTRFVD
ncbi:hypothetical protein [uncultured Algimonas sp.]|uniref:hypothetical protein n=1 Tax=uncultured Algimonas sp. TaxID=1547920 RepID=UPI002618F8F3|nr:hypothetical protein [uncultured Algimonas sp.]